LAGKTGHFLVHLRDKIRDWDDFRRGFQIVNVYNKWGHPFEFQGEESKVVNRVY
jgi:hypothetical protein